MVKKDKGLIELGLLTGVSGFAVGALPSNADTTPIKQNVTHGISRFSRVFPTAFALKRTEMVVKTSGKLVKTTNRLDKPKKKVVRRRKK